MQTTNFKYRQQLAIIYWRIEDTIIDLFYTAFEIGLEEEWQDLRDSLNKGDSLPISIEYLETIQHELVPGLIEMIKILFKIQDTLENINQMTELELYGENDEKEKEESSTEDGEEEIDENPGGVHGNYLDKWMVALQLDFLAVFDSIATLAYQGEPPAELYDLFLDKVYGGGTVLDSSDYNVFILMDALNGVCEIFGRPEFCE